MSGKGKQNPMLWIGLAVVLAGGAFAAWYYLLRTPPLEQLTILLSGNTQAYVANCGCAGGQSGGELRQARVARQELADGTVKAANGHGPKAAILLEAGNFSDPSTPLLKIQSEAMVEGLRSLKYDVVGLGSKELEYPQQELLALLGTDLPLTCCNVEFKAPKPSFAQDKHEALQALVKPYRILKLAGGYRVGVIHAIQSGNVEGLGDLYGYSVMKPVDAVGPLLEKHHTEADYWILTMADADATGDVPAGLEKLTDLNIIFGFAAGNPLQDNSGKAIKPRILPAPYHKAKDLMRIRQYFDDEGNPGVLTDEAMALRADVKYDDELNKSWEKRQLELEKLAADEANQLISSRASAKPPFYVGQNACIECHGPIVSQMASTKHPHAYITLIDKGVEKNASCVGCHTVGFGTAWGWNVKEDQPSLEGVQCENCHGPASYHIDLYKKHSSPADLQADGRDKLGLLPATKDTCMKCHTPDNDEHFDFDTYWPKIKH